MGCACVSNSDRPRHNINNYKTNNITNHTIVTTNIANLNNDRLINCIIDKDNKKINEKIKSNYTIKDLKQNIIDNYYKKEKKDIKLYYKGKLVQDDRKINDIIQQDSEIANKYDLDTLNLSMISFSLSEISKKNEKEMFERESVNITISSMEFKNSEKPKKLNNIKKEDKYYKDIIEKLSPLCEIHKTQKKLYICLECQISLCDNCIEEHISKFNEHQVIEKEQLIVLNNELYDIKNETNENLLSMGLKKDNKLDELNNNIEDDYIHPSEIFKDIKKDINETEKEVMEIIENLRRKYKEINSNFELDFENSYPNILEYNEKVDLIIDEMNNEKPFSNETNFISTYNKCQNLKKLKDKQVNNLEEIKNELIEYKKNLEKFKKNTERINKLLSREYNKIINENIGEDFKDDNSSFAGSKSNIISRGGSINHSLFGGKPKLNLMTLLSTSKDRKTLIQSLESSMKEKNSNNGLKKIIEEKNPE